MRQTSTYKTVDELPNLLDKAKQPEFKSVDELPDLKKKVSGDGSKEPLDGGLSGTTSTTEPIPTIEMYQTPTGDLTEDPFNQVKKAKELLGKTKVVSKGGIGGMGMGTTGTEIVPDEEATKEANKIQEELKRTGYKEDFFAGISDLPEDVYNNPTTSKETLSVLYKNNPVKFTQLTNEAKNKYAIRDAAAKKAYDEAQGDDKQKTEYASRVGILKGNEYSGDEIAPPENMQQFYDIVRQKQQLIDQNIDSPEEKKKAQERLRQTYAQAINPTSLDFREEYQNSGLADKLDVTQYAGLKTYELFEPEKAKVLRSMVEANITPQWNVNVQVTPEEQVRSIVTDSAMAEKMGGTLSQLTVNKRIGKEEALRELSLLGATNEYDSIVSEQNDLKNKYKEAQTDEEKANIYAKMLLNEQRANDLQKTEAKNDERYPITAKLKMDNLVKEIVQDRGIGVGGWMYNKYAHGVGSGVDAVENLVTSIFGSEKEKTDLRMKRIGEGKQFEASIYLPESERSINSPVIIQASDELKKKAKEILNGRSLSELSPDEKNKLSQLVASNQDQIKTITNPEAGKSKNFWSKATGMTIAGFTADMGSFLTKMGLMQGVGMGAKAAEATTLFMDGYEPAFNKKLAEGASVESANEYGILHGAVLSLMSKFGSKYETIKNVVKGGNSPISKYIAGLSEESWNKLAGEAKPLLSRLGKASKDIVKEQGKMIGTFGVAAPVTSAVADNLFYDEGRSVREIADEALLSAKEMAIGGIGFGLFGLAKGVMKTKATPVEKAALFEMADYSGLGKMRIDEAVKSREISKEEGERKKGIIDNVSRLVEQVPEVNDKGKPLNDQQRANYLFNLAVKESQKEKAKTLPEKQAEEAKQKALVADKENQIELEALTEKQLNDRKDKLEKAISKVDEKGKPELSDKEMADAKAELQAVENIIKSKGDTSKTEEKLPKLSEPIEGVDEFGVPIGENVPPEVKGEPENISKPIELSVEPKPTPSKAAGQPTVDKVQELEAKKTDIERRRQEELNNVGVKQKERAFSQLRDEKDEDGKVTKVRIPEEKLNAVNLIERNVAEGSILTKEEQEELQKTKDELASQGYEVPKILGQKYHEGMKVLVTNSIPDKTLAEGEEVITKVLNPQINKDGKMVQTAQIEVTVGTKKGGLTREQWLEEQKKKETRTDKINAKYDAELAELENPTPSKAAEQPTVDNTLTQEAKDLLKSIGEGSKPTFITKNLERIAKENGIEVTDKMSADDVINALKEKQKQPSEQVGSVVGKTETQTKPIEGEPKTQINETEIIKQGQNQGDAANIKPLDEKTITTKFKEIDHESITDPYDKVLSYFGGDGKINSSSINEIFGGKDSRIRQKASTENERRARISLIGKDAPTIDQLAHELWEKDISGKHTTQDYKNAIERVISDYNSKSSMMKDLVERYDLDAAYQKYLSQHGEDFSRIYDNLSEAEINHLLRMEAEKKSEQEISDYIDSLTQTSEPITEPVTKPIPEVTEPTKEQGIKEAVPEGTIETGRTEPEGTAAVLDADVKKAILDAAIGKKSEKGKQMAMEEEAAKYGEQGQKVLSEIIGGEPPKPPVETIEGKGDGELNDKGVLNHLVSAKNVPEEARKGFEEKGLKYNTASQKEAEDVAKSVIDEYGIDNAVLLAEAQKFDGDVNSLIYAESLNRLAKLEESAKTPQEKNEFAKRFAEIGIKYDEAARKGGRFNSAINYFYKKSPLGLQMIENAKRKQAFEEWAKPKEKSWKEFFDEMMKEPEFEAQVKEQVKEGMKKERAEARAARIKKVDEFFDKAKDEFKGGAAYSTIIPPKVITTALEGMKQAYHAGEKVAEIVQKAIDYISEQLGHAEWDKEKFRKEWTEKLKDKETKKPLTDEEIKAKILDKFRNKLKGLTDKEKEEVVRKSFQKIVESGGLDYADFKKIIADITGQGELTESEVARLKELVKETNVVDEAAEKARTERTQEARQAYFDAQTKAAKASKELNQLLYNKPNIVKRLTSIMQLNTLGIPALVNNPIYNIWNQTTLRLPVGLVKTVIDQAIKYGSGGKIAPETNIVSKAAQAEFFSKLGLGTKESMQQFFTGLNRADYVAKEIQGQQIRPATAIRDLWSFFKGEKNLTNQQALDKTLQATVGIPAEIVARTLNLGDKPQRFAAEGAQAAAFAKALGLKDIDYDLFIDFPREEAYRAYKAKGLSDAEAAKKADYIKDTIIKEGERSTFQQDNMLNDLINRAFGGEKSGIGSLAKSVTISPYIKIPSNAYWSYYNLVNPEVAFLQSMIYGAKAYAKKTGKVTRFIGDKYNTSAAKDLNEAKYWFAHGAVGMATRAVVVSLVGAGIVRPSNTAEDTKKEREGEQDYEQQGTINVSKLFAAAQGKDPNQIKNGLNVQMRWFGHWGTVADAVARKEEEMKPEQKKQQKDFWETAFGGMEIDALKDLNQGVFGNTSSLLTAIERKDFQNYGVNLINMFTNIVQPAALAQAEKAAMPYYTKQKADSFLGELNNTMLTRSKLYRDLTNQYPPSKIGIWGDKLEKKDNFGMRLFGISRANPDNFAQPIYEDYKRTNNTKFLPPSVRPIIEKNGVEIKLPTKDAAKLEELVGQQRKNLISPYVNDMATFEGSNKVYSKLSDSEKEDKLRILYEEGYKNGKELFLKEHPEYNIPDKTRQEKIEDKKESRANRRFRKALQKK